MWLPVLVVGTIAFAVYDCTRIKRLRSQGKNKAARNVFVGAMVTAFFIGAGLVFEFEKLRNLLALIAVVLGLLFAGP